MNKYLSISGASDKNMKSPVQLTRLQTYANGKIFLKEYIGL